MDHSHNSQNVIALRAPDEFLSGLLCIAFAARHTRPEGTLDTYPAQESAWYLLGLLRGSARITCEAGCILLTCGQALWVNAETPLDILFHEESELIIFCLKGNLSGTVLQTGSGAKGAVYASGASVLDQTCRSLENALVHTDAVSAQYASGAAYQALMALYEIGSISFAQEKPLPQVVETALKLLQQDFAFLDGIGDLSDRLQVSQEYLTRIFRAHMGITPGKYLVQIRVEQAKLLLQQGDHSIAFVADACGFTNCNYFARVFRSIVGVTPSVYARQHRVFNPLPHPMLDSIYVL
ncbi:MAG: helix-turn-helix transcriptional regulator [Oscillospiraceae bacterium]|nr:helix-turn-helix transcriptional regulator [Oscillospiraceae bacterium]